VAFCQKDCTHTWCASVYDLSKVTALPRLLASMALLREHAAVSVSGWMDPRGGLQNKYIGFSALEQVTLGLLVHGLCIGGLGHCGRAGWRQFWVGAWLACGLLR
jgi:hypothetical protein